MNNLENVKVKKLIKHEGEVTLKFKMGKSEKRITVTGKKGYKILKLHVLNSLIENSLSGDVPNMDFITHGRYKLKAITLGDTKYNVKEIIQLICEQDKDIRKLIK